MGKTAEKAGFLGFSIDVWMYLLLGLGAVLTTVDLVLAFLFAPLVLGAGAGGTAVINGVAVSNQLLLSQKIFFFHVPVAISSFLVILFAAYYSIRFLMTRDKGFDIKARVATEVTLMLVVLTLITGDLWTRYEWDAWWVWEPRLTTYFILTLLVAGYFVLRNSVEDEERRAVYAAVFCIIAAVDAPISFMITRLVPTKMHPVVLRSGGGLTGIQLLAFLLGMFGMLMIAWVVFKLRERQEFASERIEALKAARES
ncbi:MAG: cytochrome c biogenesis protein [Coriobacteriia bacterium]|nr:cytochrome c biogenesis protein [Coriobacteriia bacterium]